MKKSFIIICFAFLSSCLSFTVTSSNVANKITGLNREMSQIKADLEIKNQIKESIESSKIDFINYNNIRNFGYYEINVVEGRALLTGAVYDNKIKSFILSKVRENLKVREILDELVISSINRHTFNDYLIKKMIKMKMFFKTKVRSMNYELSVINGYTYVIGIANNGDEIDILTKTISTVKGVKEVISYVITVDSDKKVKFIY